MKIYAVELMPVPETGETRVIDYTDPNHPEGKVTIEDLEGSDAEIWITHCYGETHFTIRQGGGKQTKHIGVAILGKSFRIGGTGGDHNDPVVAVRRPTGIEFASAEYVYELSPTAAGDIVCKVLDRTTLEQSVMTIYKYTYFE